MHRPEPILQGANFGTQMTLMGSALTVESTDHAGNIRPEAVAILMFAASAAVVAAIALTF
jgi:hypothetical protein